MITQESITTSIYVFYVFAGMMVVGIGLLAYWDAKTRIKLKYKKGKKK